MLPGTLEPAIEAGEFIGKGRDDECLKISDLVDTSWSKRQADDSITMLKETCWSVHLTPRAARTST